MKRTKKTTGKRVARRNITPAMVSQAETLLGAPISPRVLAAIGKEYARVSNPGKGAFARCVRKVAQERGITSPAGVCATAGRKKYGAAKFQKMARAGKKKHKQNPAKKRKTGRNPIEAAEAKYREFHGRDADEVFEFDETVHEHTVLSGLGKLISLKIAAVDGKHEVDLSNFKGAMLAQNEEGTQLFIVGGDQSVTLSDFGIIGQAKEQEFLGAALEVGYETQKDHLGKAGGAGERAVHVHDFGSKRQIPERDARRRDGSRLPIVLYDTRNKKLMFAGGGYDLPAVGIRG